MYCMSILMGNDNTHQVIEHLFRHETGKIVSHLVKKSGSGEIELIEDAVQHALLRAMQTWAFHGIPLNPSGWILRVAQNYLTDQFRKRKNQSTEDHGLNYEIHDDQEAGNDLDDVLKDDLLRMMFACCHQELRMESQIILSLKILCGFSNKEVARALIKSEEAIAKAYTRAKTRFKQKISKLEVPVGRHLNERLDVILKVIYVLFNEGYHSISVDELIRQDLCFEAQRLTDLLLDNPLLRKPKVHALKALFCFQSSRFNARFSQEGELLNLQSQNRDLWDHILIQKGLDHLQLSYAFGNISEYHLEASIAAYHATSSSFDSTDWESIYHGYKLLEKIKPGPVVTLNRIVAESMFKGPDTALHSMIETDLEKSLKGNYLLLAVKADLHEKLGNLKKAITLYRQAIQNASNISEKNYLEKKILNLVNDSH